MPIDAAHAIVASRNPDISSSPDGSDSSEENHEPKAEALCGSCYKYKKTIESLQLENDNILKENERLKKQNRDLRNQNAEIMERSEELTCSMASVLETSGALENVNDEYSNTKLAKLFEKLYDNQWVKLSEWLEENNSDLSELERVKALSTLMKDAYEECLKLADDQIRRFLFLESGEELPSPNDEVTLFKIRRANGRMDNIRKSVIKKILCSVLNEEKTHLLLPVENKKEAEQLLKEFFHEYIDICWLMLISNPRLLLEFKVIGKAYNGVIKEHFKQYSTQESVESSNIEKDCIYEVVWPCVILEDRSGVFTKGDVITVDVCTMSDGD
ncbi:uncharacterized protein LOC132723032 isoform X2 [Ruditapes philippinarum]|uniref:uncharacterized protein LOC132723032 isoform X2 n=1 Tax=Ruditapes philippinarum TaxID=129788 RepID=UPI00295B8F75|nr:uncharacterized protein LOC132723032 isoform X2 [Ruditapes philippinarum]